MEASEHHAMNNVAATSSPLRRASKLQRQELEELFVIWQTKLLHPLDSDRWTEVFESTVRSLLMAKPLQSLSKSGRLAVAMCIVGSGQTDLLSPTVLVVLACDWIDEWASFKLLQDTVRQASLSHIRRHCDPTGGAPPRNWSRGKIADVIDNGVEDIIAGSWRALGLKGAARDGVEKVGRQLRGLAARCRGASDQTAARDLWLDYLDSNRIEGFIQALVSWGQNILAENRPTIFDEAFPFLQARQVQASRLRAEQSEVAFGRSGGGNETGDFIESPHPTSLEARHSGSAPRPRPKGQHTPSWVSISDVSRLQPSPLSEANLALESDERTRDEEMWCVTHIDEDDEVTSGGTHGGGKGGYARRSIEQRNKKRRVLHEGDDDQPLPSLGVAEDDEIVSSATVFADAGEASTRSKAGQDRLEELVSSHAEQRQGNHWGDSEPKILGNYGSDREKDEDEVETDEELVGGACGNAWGQEVEKITAESNGYRNQEWLEKESPTERRSPSPLRQSVTGTEKIALDGGHHPPSRLRKEAGQSDGQMHNESINEDTDSVVGSPLGAVPVGRQRVYGSGGMIGVAQRMKAFFYQS